MPRNFVILYFGREGSSPIITALAGHPNITVPVFEHLDSSNFEAVSDGRGIGATMHAVFSSGRLGAVEPLTGDVPESSARGEKRAVGFKWRPFAARQVLNVLREHDVVMFVLSRRNVLQRALSVFFTHEFLHRPYVQFELAKMGKDEGQKLIDEIQAISFDADGDFIRSNIEKASSSKAQQLNQFALPYKEMGGEVRNLFYEDYLRDPLAFINACLRSIQCSEVDSLPSSQFKKVNRRDIEQQVTNLDEIRQRTDITSAVGHYNELIEELENLCTR